MKIEQKMMKFAKLSALFLVVLSILFGSGQMELGCNAANARPSWRTKLPDGSIFFPYSWCLAFKIQKVEPHLVYEGRTDIAELDVHVKVEYVLREGTQTSERICNESGQEVNEAPIKAGDTITLCLSKEPNFDLRKYLSSLENKTQVWAFSTATRNNNGKRLHFSIRERFEPFHDQEFSTNDLKELASDLAPVIKDPQKAKLPIERYLRDRWTEKRIREFCHKDNRLVLWLPIPEPESFECNISDNSSLQGILYPKSQLGEVLWIAYTTNNTPTRYAIVVKNGRDLWQLDRTNFDLGGSFSDDDALKMRIHDTLNFAQRISFFAHQRPPLTREEYLSGGIFSSTTLPTVPDWKTFMVEREKNTGRVVAVSCKTSSGRLSALLDNNKQIQSVTMNGKQDYEWVQSLAEANKKRVKRYERQN
ncbi:MAG: hypothetical protein LCH63_11085 [Candidatus Melainabacteria bacterium]|nr:hypothetical protein [Candidatus Melainabacteria bacterium]